MAGVLDDEVAAMLALRSDIQEQALAELGQLAAYRPKPGDGGSTLKRRVPTAIPEEVVQADVGRATTRDAEQLRARLSSFQSGTSRGRLAAEKTASDEATGGAPADGDRPPIDHGLHDQTSAPAL